MAAGEDCGRLGDSCGLSIRPSLVGSREGERGSPWRVEQGFGALVKVPGFFDSCSTPNPSKSETLEGKAGRKKGACRCLEESAGSN